MKEIDITFNEPRDIDYFKFKDALENLKEEIENAKDNNFNIFNLLDKFEKEVLE
jgi:type IV secretory pathway VirB4 component